MRIDGFVAVVCLVTAGCGEPGASQPAVAAQGAADVGVPAAPDPAASLVAIRDLAGRWRVAGVALAEGRVQALVDDDPSLIGRVMEVQGTELRWAGDRGADADVCRGAATMRVPAAAVSRLGDAMARFGAEPGKAHEIACLQGGTWPMADGGALLLPLTPERVVMTWRDNAVLLLEKLPG